ncbi:hypothetical protein P3W45_000536 [Vairimorpha bombi]
MQFGCFWLSHEKRIGTPIFIQKKIFFLYDRVMEEFNNEEHRTEENENCVIKESDDEDKILLEREYIKYISHINKIRDMDDHQKYKDIGYTEAYKRFNKNNNLVRVLIGYLKSKKEEFYEILYDIIKKEEELSENIPDEDVLDENESIK